MVSCGFKGVGSEVESIRTFDIYSQGLRPRPSKSIQNFKKIMPLCNASFSTVFYMKNLSQACKTNVSPLCAEVLA